MTAILIPVLLYLVAAALRITYLEGFQKTPLFHSPGLDQAYYLATAKAIANGQGMGSEVYFMGPLYPYALAVIGRAVGFATSHLLLVQSLLGSFGPPLLYLLARRYVGRVAAIVAAVAMAAYGMLILYDHLFLMEWLLTLLLLLTLLVLSGAGKKSGVRRFVLAGAILGLAALGRGSVLFFAPFVLVWIAVGPSFRSAPALRWRWAAGFLAGLALAIAPVTIRNYAVGKDLVIISSNGGLNLFIGNNPMGRGTYLPLDRIARAAGVKAAVDVNWMLTDPSGKRIAEAARGRTLKPSEVSSFWSERAMASIRADPGRALQIFGRKILLVWNAIEVPQIEDQGLYRDLIPFLRLPLVRFGWIAPLALLGVVLAITSGEWRRWLLILLFLLAFTLSVAVFFVTARYRVPIVPAVILMAAYAGESLVRRAKPPNVRALAWPLLVLAAFAVLVHLPLAHFDRSGAYVSLGAALADEGKFDEAITAFERARALAPGDPVAASNLGATMLKAGRNADAARIFKEATERFPRVATLWRGLGESEARQNHAPEAAAAFRTATTLDPRDPMLWLRLGGAEFASGRVDSARAALAHGLAVNPENRTLREFASQMEAAIAAGVQAPQAPR
jgi:tetratricopeptide (TPR) repeat protein